MADRLGVSLGAVRAVLDGRSWGWLRTDEAAQSLVEYAILLALIAVIAVIALIYIGTQVSAALSDVGNSI